jgi:hypothetical protein
MKVLINGRYAYETDLADVRVGDEMVLPGGLGVRETWLGIVTALEPEYDGPCSRAIGLSRRHAQVESEREALAEVKIEGWQASDEFSKPCTECGQERRFLVEDVNRIGRPTSVSAQSCKCGAAATSTHFGSAEGFRLFVIGEC